MKYCLRYAHRELPYRSQPQPQHFAQQQALPAADATLKPDRRIEVIDGSRSPLLEPDCRLKVDERPCSPLHEPDCRLKVDERSCSPLHEPDCRLKVDERSCSPLHEPDCRLKVDERSRSPSFNRFRPKLCRCFLRSACCIPFGS